MKINFSLPTDNQYHQYCPECYSENISRIFEGDNTFYFCDNCLKKSPRLIVIDPTIVWWIDEKTREYWHESIGVFVFDYQNKALFFKRTIYPFALTIPAGHLDIEENSYIAAKRELYEETGIKSTSITLFSEEAVVGDKCRRGANNHKWHLYTTRIKKVNEVKINDEGVNPVWLTLEEALQEKLTYPVRYFIEKYGSELLV